MTRLGLIMLLVAWLTVPAGAQVKSWTDEKGVTHYGNAPKKPLEREPIKIAIRKPKPFNPGADQRRSAEAYLQDLHDDLIAAELNDQRIAMAAEIDMFGKVGSAKIDGDTAWRVKIADLKGQLYGPIRADLLQLEKVIKEHHSGALPAWLKDNRAWRDLDAKFTRR